jgi:signal transduction histidine kinase
MCQDIVEMYNYKAVKDGKSISYAGPQQIYVFADAALIERVIHNFVSNALVHTPPETRVGVAINVTKEGKVKVSVYDSGSGIKQEDIPHLFDKYYRSRKSSGKQGTGLGLAIVKTILENHGFEYGVESEIGKGSTFWFIM